MHGRCRCTGTRDRSRRAGDGDWSIVSGLNANVTAGATWTNRGLAPVVDQPSSGNKVMSPEDDGLEIIQFRGGFQEITP